MANVASLLRLDPEPTLEINPADAERRSICKGDVVRVFNDRGQVKLRARLSQRMKPSVINIAQGQLPEQYIHGHHNQLTHDYDEPTAGVRYGAQCRTLWCPSGSKEGTGRKLTKPQSALGAEGALDSSSYGIQNNEPVIGYSVVFTSVRLVKAL